MIMFGGKSRLLIKSKPFNSGIWISSITKSISWRFVKTSLAATESLNVPTRFKEVDLLTYPSRILQVKISSSTIMQFMCKLLLWHRISRPKIVNIFQELLRNAGKLKIFYGFIRKYYKMHSFIHIYNWMET